MRSLVSFVLLLYIYGISASAQRKSPDAALEAPLVLYNPPAEYAPSVRTWQGIPGIERSPNGRLWAVWYTGGKTEGPDNFVLVVTSSDEGKTWSKQTLVIALPKDTEGYLREYDPCFWLDSMGRLWLFWA